MLSEDKTVQTYSCSLLANILNSIVSSGNFLPTQGTTLRDFLLEQSVVEQFFRLTKHPESQLCAFLGLANATYKGNYCVVQNLFTVAVVHWSCWLSWSQLPLANEIGPINPVVSSNLDALIDLLYGEDTILQYLSLYTLINVHKQSMFVLPCNFHYHKFAQLFFRGILVTSCRPLVSGSPSTPSPPPTSFWFLHRHPSDVNTEPRQMLDRLVPDPPKLLRPAA